MASTVPPATGASVRGGRARAMSSAATTKPPSSRQPSVLVAPDGSHATPAGTPNITTARRSVSGSRAQPIQGPAHENESACSTGTSPRPRPPSHRLMPQSTPSASTDGAGRSSGVSSRIVARQATKVAASGDSPALKETSRMDDVNRDGRPDPRPPLDQALPG